MKRRALRVTVGGETLAEFIGRELAMDAAAARALVETGAVYVGGRRCSEPARKLRGGDAVVAVLEEGGRDALDPIAPMPSLQILFEDAALIAVAKPAGVVTQPTPSRQGESLADQVSNHLAKDAGLVHRLDRETSGVIVFGKSKEATSRLAEQFRKGTAAKRYLAVAGPGLPEQGTIDLPISPDPSRPGRYRATRTANGEAALTLYRTLHAAPDHTLVALFPKTGRTHQLRAHLTALGAPIAGDARYQGAGEVGGKAVHRCLLHAQALRLTHPIDHRPLLFEAPLPADLAEIFAADGVAPPSGPWDDPTAGLRR